MLSENNMRTNLYLKWTIHTLFSVGTILARTIQSAVGYFNCDLLLDRCIGQDLSLPLTSFLTGSHCLVIKPFINFRDPKCGL